jgi:hypothetical protein
LQPAHPLGPGLHPQQASALEEEERKVEPDLKAKRLKTFEACA